MLNADALSFQEFAMQESLPLATIHSAVLEFLRDREDVVLFGAQAVNAYVSEPRMTQDIDILAIHASEFAEELRQHLGNHFHIAVRLREVAAEKGYRLYQVQKSGNRHLVDIRGVDTLPRAQRIERVLVVEPAELIALKIIAFRQRRGQPKSGTDWRDLAVLLLAFPEFKQEEGPVAAQLKALTATPDVFEAWKDLVSQEIQPPDEDGEF
jgi:Nucleotidyl transferase AbiEii toxin, Type IV TA system